MRRDLKVATAQISVYKKVSGAGFLSVARLPMTPIGAKHNLISTPYDLQSDSISKYNTTGYVVHIMFVTPM